MNSGHVEGGRASWFEHFGVRCMLAISSEEVGIASWGQVGQILHFFFMKLSSYVQ